jgi:hypothetical protein
VPSIEPDISHRSKNLRRRNFGKNGALHVLHNRFAKVQNHESQPRSAVGLPTQVWHHVVLNASEHLPLATLRDFVVLQKLLFWFA